MKLLFVSIDSLRWDMLSAFQERPTGFGYPVETKNLDRFADNAITFEKHYAGSLPCMPARREWFTGTQEFLWRPWGPIEPFDNPLPRVIRDAGTPTQLITDHYHYFQHGSDGYYQDYNGFEFIRGHEWDQRTIHPKLPGTEAFRQQINASGPENLTWRNRLIYARNVESFEGESDFFAPRVFSTTADWLGRDEWDEWFLYVDSFDVHEPFHVPEPYTSMYTDEDPTEPDLSIWPYYGRIDERGTAQTSTRPEGSAALSDRQVEFVRSQFAGKTTMVDRWFGRVLDVLDDQELWDDTVVIVTSDHGHYLGDHGWMGKPFAPLYNTLARTPLLIWHPESPRLGETISALTSAVDLYGTILDILDVNVPHRHSRSLFPLIEGDRDDHRDWALYGYWGSSINVTDGTHTYLHPGRDDGPLSLYSTRMMNPYRTVFEYPTPKPDAKPASLPYTDVPVWQIPAEPHSRHGEPLLFDVEADPHQHANLAGRNRGVEDRLRHRLHEALEELHAPPELHERLGIGEQW